MVGTQALRSSALFHVRDHVAVVTGGGTGIGLMAAQALAANGAKVYILGRRQEALEAAAESHEPDNGAIVPCPCDVRSKDDLERVVKIISAKEEYVNILVTSAGKSGTKAEPDSSDANELKAKLWNNETVEAWNDVYDADVTSVYFTTIAFLPLLQGASRKHGDFSASVITISSMSGMMRHAQGHFSYNAAKGAAIQLTKLMSAEFLRVSVRVNSIAPGYFPSELTAKQSGSDQKSDLPNSYVESRQHVPANRPGADEEMAQTVLFLAKNQYVNGEVIAVDGGVLNVVAGR
ncbi:MAG: hypothetical protein M1828_007178 [Chrysothrix sp. TS-e1954]|nr:MAG: hypothetical protein M1828_007178 [Chrysothrix sp. TS-e1954]